MAVATGLLCVHWARSEEAHQLRLLDEGGGVAADVVHNLRSSSASEGGLALARHEKRIHQRLGVVPPDADEEAADEPPHHDLGVVDPRDHLQPLRT